MTGIQGGISATIQMFNGIISNISKQIRVESNARNIAFDVAKGEYVALYLYAADVFVLTTLHEGCCNAIVEAMACGLPVISSNLPFNWDVLNERNSIMIDPNDIEEIKKAIVLLRDDETKRKTMAGEALRMAQELSIDVRAQRILEFVELKIKH